MGISSQLMKTHCRLVEPKTKQWGSGSKPPRENHHSLEECPTVNCPPPAASVNVRKTLPKNFRLTAALDLWTWAPLLRTNRGRHFHFLQERLLTGADALEEVLLGLRRRCATMLREAPTKRARPVRVGIVGLSSKPGAWATLAHLPRLTSSPNCKIVALCNSTLQSTQAAIAAHSLDSSVKAYQSPGELALDPNVDLVVVSTRADTHLSVAEPALRAGKDVFVEWPLAATTEDAAKMVTLAKEAKVRTMIGLQGRMSPTVLKIKSMVDAGELGAIHSVSYQGVVNIWQHNAADERYSHFIDRKVGGNLLTIYGGHTLDSIFFALGELKPKSYKPLAVNFRPKMHLAKPDGSLTSEVYEKDTPDQILLQGQLDRDPPAVLSFHLRAGSRFLDPEAPGSTWRIYGTKGELVVNFASAGPQMAKANFMRFSDFETGQARDVKPDEGGSEWEDLPKQGQNIGRLYEAYAADGDYGDFDLALKRHELLDEFWETMS